MDSNKGHKNIKKKLLHGFFWTLLVLFYIPVSLTFLSNQPLFQTFTARMVTNILTDATGYKFTVNSIKIELTKGIEAGGLALYDHHDNIMIKIGDLKVKPIFTDFRIAGIIANSIEIDSLDFRLGTYNNEEKLNLVRFIRSLSDTTTKSSGKVFKLKVKNIAITRSHFQLFNRNDSTGNGKAMDPSNMVFDNIDLKVNNFKLINDSLNFTIDKLSANELHGMKARNLRMDFILSSTTIRGHKLKGSINHSNLDADIELNYHGWDKMGTFLDSVQLIGNFRKTKLYLSDIGYFSDVMFPMKDSVVFSGQVAGTVEDFHAKNLAINYGKETHIDGDFSFKEITEVLETKIEADIRDFTTSYCEVKSFLLPSGDGLPTPNYLNCKDKIKVEGSFNGNYFDFNTKLNFTSDNAPLATETRFKYNEEDTLFFNIQLEGNNLKLGHFMGLDKYFSNGNIAGTISGNGTSFNDVLVKANLKLHKLHVLNYTYDTITFNGSYQADSVYGLLTVTDDNLKIKLDGGADFKSPPSYKAHADIEKANLKTLNLIEDDFSFATKADLIIEGSNIDNLIANLHFNNSLLVFGDTNYYINSIDLEKYDSAGAKVITINSDILNGRISGQYKLAQIENNLKSLLNHYIEVDDQTTQNIDSSDNFKLKATLKDGRLIQEQFLSGFTLENGTHLSSAIDFNTKKVNVLVTSPFMAYDDIRLKDNNFKILSIDNKLVLKADVNHIILKDSTSEDKQIISMDHFEINASAASNMIDFKVKWKNNDSLKKNSADIRGYFYKTDIRSELTLDNVKVNINDTLWTLDKNNRIFFDSSGVVFNNINISGGSSKLSFQGKVPRVNGDSLIVRFNQWNLSNFDALLKNSGIDLDGYINGDLEVSIIENNPTIISSLTVNDLGLNSVHLGDAKILNTWNNTNKSIFIKAQIIRKGNVGAGEVLLLDGFYFPFKQEDGIQVHADFNRINIALVNPFLKNLFHGIEGTAKGYLDFSGTLSKPILMGKVELDRASLIVNYLNTRYSFSNYLEFKKNEINFDNIVIFDTLGNKGIVNGSLTHNYFSDFSYDIKVTTDKLLFVNTNRKMNELYYGNALVSGIVHLWGSPTSIQLDANATTVEGTDLNIPLDYVYDVSDNDYITFIPPPNDTLSLNTEKEHLTKEEELNLKEEQIMGYDIKLKTSVTPAAKVNIFLPSDLGRIESQGKGILDIDANSEGTFSIVGDYMVKKGYFHFTFKNLISKRFDLVEGGKISWTGDPVGANINIKGLYKVKTDVSSLGVVIDSTTSYKNKIMVNCYITLTNTLLDPNIKFSFDIPDADPDLKRMIFANLDTTNASVVNEQMISLLVLGTFSYSNAGNVNLATSGYSILTNQLSGMLSKMSDKFDIGVNYKPGDAVSQQEFEVALSTQLFNDRLTIDGNLGMTYDQSQGNASNIVGDVDVAYKLTKDGRWLLKAFNHSNSNSWYYYNNYDKVSPYTQGVGVAYKKDFNNIHELFTRQRPKKKINNDDKKE